MPFLMLRSALSKSGLLQMAASVHPRTVVCSEQRQQRSRYSSYFFLRTAEESFFLGGGARLLSFLGTFSLGSFGQMGALYGLFSTVLWFLSPTHTQLTDLILSLGIMLSSVPMMHIGNSLYSEIVNSRLLGSFFFDFCGCLRSESPQSVRHTRGWGIPIALIGALVGAWIPIGKQLTILLSALALYLLFMIPELGVCTLLLLFPFLNLFDSPTMILLVFVLLLTAAWLKKALCGRRSLRFDLLDRFVLLLMLIYVMGGIISVGGRAGLLEGITRAALLLVWFPIRNLLENVEWRRRAGVSLSLAAVSVALLGIAEYVFGSRELLFVDLERFGNLGSRVCGTYQNPNFFALYLVLTAPFLLIGFLDDTRKKILRVPAGLGLVAVILCIILTWTRGAWLGLAVSALLFLLLYSPQSFVLLFFSPIIAALTAPFLPSVVTDRLLSIVGRGDSSVHYRFYTWTGVERLVTAYPFGIGVGESAFRSVYPRFAVSGTERVMHAHRLDLQILAESGWVGLLLLVLFLGLLFLKILNGLYRLNGAARRTLLCCFCALIGALIMGAFDYIWYHFGNFTLFFILAAWSASVVWKEGEEA
ncbi:MAG: O-antigen ligase family protein [Clostridia bacterium]|nr:O-antigen ligase family protein [Clostridia bacterium]